MQLVVVMAVRKAVRAATTTFTAISIIRFFIIVHYPFSIINCEASVFIETFSTVATFAADTGADHEGRSLSGHSEATGIHTIVLSQFDARTIDGCGRHLTLSGRDAQLNLVVLVET